MASIDGYDDIHDNVRFWLGELVRCVAPVVGARTPVLYDIGANEGQIGIPLATSAGGDDTPAVRVIAFEPLPAARTRLIANATEAGRSFALWGDADVTLIPLALGDSDRPVDIEVYSDDTFSSIHRRDRDELRRYSLEAIETVQVRMRPLDDLVSGGAVPAPDIVKIDVEGAERAVLSGATGTLRELQPIVLMEFSCINAENAGYRRNDLIEVLRRCGYQRFYGLFRNTERALRGEAEFGDCRIWNVIAIPDRWWDVCAPRLKEER